MWPFFVVAHLMFIAMLIATCASSPSSAYVLPKTRSQLVLPLPSPNPQEHMHRGYHGTTTYLIRTPSSSLAYTSLLYICPRPRASPFHVRCRRVLFFNICSLPSCRLHSHLCLFCSTILVLVCLNPRPFCPCCAFGSWSVSCRVEHPANCSMCVYVLFYSI